MCNAKILSVVISLNCLLLSMNSTNETLLFDRFLIMYDLCVFTCIIFIFVFRCTHVQMSYVLNSYLLTYLLTYFTARCFTNTWRSCLRCCRRSCMEQTADRRHNVRWQWRYILITVRGCGRNLVRVLGSVSFDQKWKTRTGRPIFYGHYISIFNHCDVICVKIYRIRWQHATSGLLRRSRSFKVIEVATNRNPVCDFPLVINSNGHPISYSFGVIAAYCSKFGRIAFSAPFVGLGTTYDAHLRLTGKHVVDVLLVLTELCRCRCYGWGATRENRSKIGDFAPTRLLWSKISGRRYRPHQSFLHW